VAKPPRQSTPAIQEALRKLAAAQPKFKNRRRRTRLRKFAAEFKSSKSQASPRKLTAGLKSPTSEAMREVATPVDFNKLKEFDERWNRQQEEGKKHAEEQRKFREFFDEHEAISRRSLARELARELSRNEKTPPVTTEPIDGRVDTPAWITAHLKQMIERNKIPEDGVRIGKLSELLEADMLTAAETNKWLKPVTAHYIRTHLREWVAAAGLAIKIL
jgi:hypothetical protein